MQNEFGKMQGFFILASDAKKDIHPWEKSEKEMRECMLTELARLGCEGSRRWKEDTTETNELDRMQRLCDDRLNTHPFTQMATGGWIRWQRVGGSGAGRHLRRGVGILPRRPTAGQRTVW